MCLNKRTICPSNKIRKRTGNFNIAALPTDSYLPGINIVKVVKMWNFLLARAEFSVLFNLILTANLLSRHYFSIFTEKETDLRKSSSFDQSPRPSDSGALVESSEQECDLSNDTGKCNFARKKRKNSDEGHRKTPKLQCARG